MKRILIASLIVVLMLVATMAVPAMAAEERSVGATVTVTEYINFNVTDYDSDTVGGPGGDGLTFGSLDPGTSDNPEGAQTLGTPTAAVNLAVGAETNVNCNIQIKGTDFTYSTYSIGISNASWDTDSNVSGATAMDTAYDTITTSTAGAATSQDVWHWLSVPSGQYAATYTTTFYYQAVKQP